MSDFETLCEAIGLADDDQGRYVHPSVETVIETFKELEKDSTTLAEHRIAEEREEWAEEDGPVLWWKFPLCEPPYVGTPLDDDFPDYVTHWTPILEPFASVYP